jgi:hypothetical protein
MALDFLANPPPGSTLTAPNGAVWTFDGTKWAATGGGTGGGGGTATTVGDTPPANPVPGQEWWDSVGGQLYIWYVDATGPGQWVIANSLTAGITDAPNDANTYGRHANAWTQVPIVGRNLLHNGLFNVQQRGQGGWSGPGYTADRWSLAAQGSDTATVNIYPMADASRAQIGDEAANFQLNCSVTGSSAANSQTLLYQPIENVRRLAGKTVTVSLWAVCSAGTPNIGINWGQNFGSGGSPSNMVFGSIANFSVGTTWSRKSVQFTLPSVAGKTFGTTAGTDYTTLYLYMSQASLAQTANIALWGVQLEIGSGPGYPTPLEKLDPQQDLSNCQRFFFAPPGGVYASGSTPGAAGSLTIFATRFFPVRMRGMPAQAGATYGASINNGAGSLFQIQPTHAIYQCLNAASGGFQLGVANDTYSADL